VIYICADDYGLNDISSMHIQQCIDEGALNKVSVFPNFDPIDLNKILKNENIRVSLHLNLVEGRCMADADEIGLIADKNGNFKYTFGGLFVLNLFNRKKLETQVYKEIKAQVLFWKSSLPTDVPFCIDSHQHTHIIPTIFKVLLKVLKDEKIYPEHIRIPAEPIMPYIKTPSLYFTYRGINIVKQWLIKFLWLFSKNHLRKYAIPTSHFFGVLFSGKMDEERVNKILPKYIKMAEKDGRDIEVLVHPGYLDEGEIDFKGKNIAFKKFYTSLNRKTEFDCVMKISMKEECYNAVY
jgi:predicted glycoside hydrolase/deacetylase ChbG (UPF0249 family)